MQSVKRRRQALKLCLDTAVIVVIEILKEFLFEMFHRMELLQIKRFTWEFAIAFGLLSTYRPTE